MPGEPIPFRADERCDTNRFQLEHDGGMKCGMKCVAHMNWRGGGVESCCWEDKGRRCDTQGCP